MIATVGYQVFQLININRLRRGNSKGMELNKCSHSIGCTGFVRIGTRNTYKIA
jgi:hypothetical protein